MKNLTKQNQNYFFITMPMLHLWFERMKTLQESSYPVVNKFLPISVESENPDSLSINFADWDIPNPKSTLVIEEYLWGVRCGTSQYLNIDNCSLSAVLEIARTDDMCEIYSPAKVQYFLDGSRKIVPHQVSAYNTAAKFSCYRMIDMEQAMNLFPQYRESFSTLPKQTKFLCSPDCDKIRIANQEKGEIGFDFNYLDCASEEISFRLGCLRATFAYIAQEVSAGKGKQFCQAKENNLDYLYSKICLLVGGEYSYEKAVGLATEDAALEIRNTYLKYGLEGKRKFTVLINGDYVEDTTQHNQFINQDGMDMTICVTPSVYASWGKPFDMAEKKIIYSERKFDFDDNADNDYFCKANRLRYYPFHIRTYQKNKHNPIISPELMEDLVEKTLQENNNAIARLVKSAKEFASRPIMDLSGPTRSSIYTNY